ncbi:MAG: LLM class flavin-dependent oxidoreductase [Dehalococcoidia bacterium]
MTQIKFGAIYSGFEHVMGPLEFAEKAEALGYDSFWVTDYIMLPRLEAFVLLSAVASRTRRIKLGTSVVVLPFRHPLHWAKAALSVDALSSGRLIFGAGIGGDLPREFEVLGLDMRQRARMSDESLGIIRRLLTGEKMSHHGRFYKFEDAGLGLKSVQKPAIPIWIGSVWHDDIPEGVVRRVARLGDGFMPVDVPAKAYLSVRQRIEDRASDLGRDPSSFQWALFTWLCLDEDAEKARRVSSEILSARLGVPWEVEPENAAAMGTPRECIEALERYVDVGVRHFLINLVCPPSEVPRQCEIFAREIMPYFKAAGGERGNNLSSRQQIS